MIGRLTGHRLERRLGQVGRQLGRVLPTDSASDDAEFATFAGAATVRQTPLLHYPNQEWSRWQWLGLAGDRLYRSTSVHHLFSIRSPS